MQDNSLGGALKGIIANVERLSDNVNRTSEAVGRIDERVKAAEADIKALQAAPGGWLTSMSQGGGCVGQAIAIFLSLVALLVSMAGTGYLIFHH